MKIRDRDIQWGETGLYLRNATRVIMEVNQEPNGHAECAVVLTPTHSNLREYRLGTLLVLHREELRGQGGCGEHEVFERMMAAVEAKASKLEDKGLDNEIKRLGDKILVKLAAPFIIAEYSNNGLQIRSLSGYIFRAPGMNL